MAQYGLEIGSKLRHTSRAALAQPHTVSLADAFENYFIPLLSHREVIAWNRIPAQFSPNRDLSVFPVR
ncbi:MAG: hypothetical protein DMG76_02735 [Acidobacteria bacterium]|nr:MAG: hypothetical protein DMG76_02735 [Acidobacteriota bacterium]